MQQIYNEFGVEVIKEDGQFYMRYDVGEIMIQVQQVKITKEEAKKIMQKKGPNDLYDYIIKNLNDRIY